MKQIKKNTQEMIHLIKQRDELLPLLMNGQVSVNSDLSIYKKYISPVFSDKSLNVLNKF